MSTVDGADPDPIGHPDEVARAFDQLPARAAFAGPEHRVVAVNAAARAYLRGCEPLGRPVREVIPEVSGQEWVEHLDAVYRGGRPLDVREGRLIVTLADGSPAERSIRVRATPT